MVDDDTLAEVLLRLPITMRIVLAQCVCKQFSALAHKYNSFKALYISSCGGDFRDTKEERNNMLRTLGNFHFLSTNSAGTLIEELKLRGHTVDLPPTPHLQRLNKLTLSNTLASTVKKLRKNIGASKLKELKLSCVGGTTDITALLKASSNLERLSLCGLDPCIDMSKIIDGWRTVHDGNLPPLKVLSIDCLGDRKVPMHDLEKLNLDEIHCYEMRNIDKGYRLPSMRALRVNTTYLHNATVTENQISSLKTLVMSCPGLCNLTLVGRSKWADSSGSDGVTLVTHAMKTEFPHLNVKVHID